jgi:hypothetical protein
VVLRSLADFDAQLRRERRSCDGDAAARWIEENTGPQPAEEMPHRVAELVARMIRDRAASLQQSDPARLGHGNANLVR